MFLKHTRTNEAKCHQERIYNLLLNLNLSDRENIKEKNMKKTRGTTLPIHLMGAALLTGEAADPLCD